VENVYEIGTWSSLARGVSPESTADARLAMEPMTVLSPVLTTIPLAVPSMALVEKKAKFFVSNGF
jgi:hypothetical protein